MTQTTPPISTDQLGGVWQRRLLLTAAGQEDVSSLVWWLQLGETCADIRAASEVREADTAFAGRLSQRGDIFTWSPEVAQGSVTDGAPDEGRLAFDGDILREEGVHSRYLEHWQRIAPAAPGDCAVGFRVDGASQPGIFLMLGSFVFVARPRPDGAPVFLLSQRNDGIARVVLALGCSARPGELVALPGFDGDELTFPTGPTGPAARYAAQLRDRIREATENSA